MEGGGGQGKRWVIDDFQRFSFDLGGKFTERDHILCVEVHYGNTDIIILNIQCWAFFKIL